MFWYNIGMLAIDIQQEIHNLACHSKGCPDLNAEDISELIWNAENREQAKEIAINHSIEALILTEDRYLEKMEAASNRLAELKESIKRGFHLFHKALQLGVLEPAEIYEYRNYLFEGLERFERSTLQELALKIEDINKIIWGANAACDDLELIMKERKPFFDSCQLKRAGFFIASRNRQMILLEPSSMNCSTLLLAMELEQSI